jgi:adhesin transport system membrane fusion protein
MHGTHIEDLTDRIKPRTASSVLLWVVTGFVVIFFVWAYFAEIERTVRGMGRVIPSSQLQVVSNLEGGIVEAILVRQGQLVRAGDPLIRLDETQTGADFGSGEATLSALAAKIARLQAEVAGNSPAYPAANNPVLAEQIAIEQSLHTSRMADLASLSAAAQARIAQAERAVAEAEATYHARVAARDSRQAEVRILRPLVERGIEPRLSLAQAESAAVVAASEAEAAAASIARARASVSEARSSFAQLRQEWRAQAANELASAPGLAGPRRTGRAHGGTRAAGRPGQPGAGHHARRHRLAGRAFGRDRAVGGESADRGARAPRGYRLRQPRPARQGRDHRL